MLESKGLRTGRAQPPTESGDDFGGDPYLQIRASALAWVCEAPVANGVNKIHPQRHSQSYKTDKITVP